MSTQDFDELARALATKAITRRKALQLVAASALGAAAGVVGAAKVAQAQDEGPPSPWPARCPDHPPLAGSGCIRRCESLGVGPPRGSEPPPCVCLRTTDDKRHCVYPCCPTTLVGCEVDENCPSGQLCVRASFGCCDFAGTSSGVCMVSCKEPVPTETNCSFYIPF